MATNLIEKARQHYKELGALGLLILTFVLSSCRGDAQATPPAMENITPTSTVSPADLALTAEAILPDLPGSDKPPLTPEVSVGPEEQQSSETEGEWETNYFGFFRSASFYLTAEVNGELFTYLVTIESKSATSENTMPPEMPNPNLPNQPGSQKPDIVFGIDDACWGDVTPYSSTGSILRLYCPVPGYRNEIPFANIAVTTAPNFMPGITPITAELTTKSGISISVSTQ